MIKRKIKSFVEDFFDVYIIKKVQPIVGMVSPEERIFFKSCSKMMAEKHGAIVDLGTWMGASAAGFAEGLRNKKGGFNIQNGKIYTFDRFIWEESMNVNFIDSERICEYMPGESFLPEVRKNLRGYKEVVEITQADLKKSTWPGKEIKILHVDAMKNEDLTTEIARNFFPHLQENSLLIQQDFKHWFTPMIHILQYRLRDYFSFLHEVDVGGTVAFTTKEVLPEKVIFEVTDFSSVTDTEANKAFEYSFSLVNKKYHPKIAAAYVMYFVRQNELPKAKNLYDEYHQKGYSTSGDMKNVKNFMAQHS